MFLNFGTRLCDVNYAHLIKQRVSHYVGNFLYYLNTGNFKTR